MSHDQRNNQRSAQPPLEMTDLKTVETSKPVWYKTNKTHFHMKGLAVGHIELN